MTGSRHRAGRRAMGRALKGLVATAVVLLAGCSSDPPGQPPPSLGVVVSRVLPSSIARATLVDQHGRRITLAGLRGRTVVLLPFLSLCQDVCPLDTGNLLQVETALTHDGAAATTTIVEMTIDPGRDSSARLAAYARLTGASWELVTETPGTLAGFERYFGWYVERVPEDDPPGIDWWTKRPLTYDIDHSNGFDLLDATGRLRFASGAAPDYKGSLNPTLRNFLSGVGREHLHDAAATSWTPAEMLSALAWLLGRSLPAGSS